MSNNQKDTIYIDVDDEITAIIEKVKTSKQRIVALVLPKRASVLQSSVNMKLLKRTADGAKKHLVLITTEAGLLPLAGAVGLYVAPSLQSRPAVPPGPGGAALEPAADESDDFDPDTESDTPVGDLAPASAFAADELETIELDNADEEADGADAKSAGTASAGAAAAATVKAPKVKKDKKLMIPDFNKFRMGVVLAVAAVIALLIFAYFANVVLPKATVTIGTDSSDIATNTSVTLDPSATELDPATKTFPAKIEKKQVTATQQAAATGQKNNGTKANGTITVSEPCTKKPASIDPGTGFSSGGLTFISTDTLKFDSTSFDANGNVVCSGDVDVVSQQPGQKYNLPSGSKFAVAGNSSATGQNSDAFTGGTDDIIKVVSQADIDNAKTKMGAGNNSSAKSDLQSTLTDDGYMPVTASLNAGDPTVTTSANVGDQADVVTVTSVTTYTMYGIKKDDLQNFILSNVKDKIDTSKQKILNDGTDSASFTVNSTASSGNLQADLSATTLAGPDLKTDTLASQIAGKKEGDVRTQLLAIPGVTNVNVKYSPFWVHTIPKKVNKITIVVQKSAANNSSNGNTP